MLRSVIPFLVIALLPHAATAQDVVLKAGLNFATDSNPYDDSSLSRRRGLVAGIAVRIPARDRVSLQLEGLYSEKGHRFGTGGLVGASTGDLRIRYVELPVLWRADFGAPGSTARVYLVGGAAPALKIDARLKINIPAFGEEEADRSDDVRNFDVGLTGGAGVEFGKVSIEARYTRGLLSIDADPRLGNTVSITNRTFMVGLGYRAH